jgi:hypothetical protein
MTRAIEVATQEGTLVLRDELNTEYPAQIVDDHDRRAGPSASTLNILQQLVGGAAVIRVVKSRGVHAFELIQVVILLPSQSVPQHLHEPPDEIFHAQRLGNHGQPPQ